MDGSGVQRLEDHDEYEHDLLAMTSYQSGSIFAETFNELLQRSLNESESLGGILEQPEVSLTHAFPTTAPLI